MSSTSRRESKEGYLLLQLFILFFICALISVHVFRLMYTEGSLGESEFFGISMFALAAASFGSIILFILILPFRIYKWKSIEEEAIPEPIVFAAHQLRSPAAGAKWALGSLLTSSTLAPNDREIVSQSFESVSRIIEIATDLMTVAELKEATALRFKEVDIIKLTGAATKDLALSADEKKLRIWIENRSNVPEVKLSADPDKIFIVISNLIDNAIRYSHLGGEVVIFINIDRENAKITVRDRGIGIPKNDQPNIFSKFYRASNARKLESHGTGLGLYLNKHIVDSHGGRIWFESAEGKGSAFHVSLPLKHKK